ncbi:MAG: tetratricopeptide repeat protein [Chloroflexota bacterium]|nr:tetratricopeptide repeat protein [Chloroflexota bacterium]
MIDSSYIPERKPNHILLWLERYELVLLALATPLLLFPGRWTLLGLVIIAISWIARHQVRGVWTIPTYLDRPICVLFLTLGVGIVVSSNLTLSLNRAAVMLLGVFLFYGLANGLRSERQVLAVALGLVLMAIGIALLGLVGTDWKRGTLIEMGFASQIYNGLPTLIRGVPGSGVPTQSELFNPRMVAGTMAFLIPVPLSLLLWGEGRASRMLSLLALPLLGMTLLLTQSPQALLGLAIGLFALEVLKKNLPWCAVLLLLAGLLLLFVLVWNLYLASALPPALVERLGIGVQARLEIWQRALYMIRDTPFTGIGLNTFPLLNDRFYSLVPDRTPHAHNTFLQTAVDLGIPGLVAFLALILMFFRTLKRTYTATTDHNHRALLLGIAGSVAAWLGYGLADALVLGHKTAIGIWVMLGLLAALNQKHPTPTNPSPAHHRAKTTNTNGRSVGATTRVALAAVALLLIPVVVSTLLLNASTLLSYRTAHQGSVEPPQRAIQLMEEATRWYGANSRVHYFLGLAARQREQDVAAQNHLSTAIQLDRGDYLAHYQLGHLYYEKGLLQDAVMHWRHAGAALSIYREAKSHDRAGRSRQALPLYQAAVALDPERYDAWYGLGTSYANLQKWDRAIKTFQTAITRFPDRAPSYIALSTLLYNQRDDPDQAIVVLTTGLEHISNNKYRAALYERLARLYLYQGDSELALATAAQSISSNPDCTRCWTVLGDIHRVQHHYSQARVAYHNVLNLDPANEAARQHLKQLPDNSDN